MSICDSNLPFARDRVGFQSQCLQGNILVQSGDFGHARNQVAAGVEHSQLLQSLQPIKGKKLIIRNVELYKIYKRGDAENRSTAVLHLG